MSKDYRPHPNTSLKLRIDTALHRLNLDRPDIAGLKDGQSIQRNIADDRWLAALLVDLKEALSDIQRLVDKQAEDEGLWFIAEYATEAHLQQELRTLHALIEHYTKPPPCAIAQQNAHAAQSVVEEA